MDDSLVLSFPYSAREHTDAYLASWPGRRLRLLLQAPGMLIGGSAIGATILSTLNNESGFWMAAVSVTSLAALWVWLVPLVLKRLTMRRLLRDSATESREKETRALSSDGFLPSEGWAHPVPWSEIGEVKETRQFFLIEASSDDVSYIPKQALSAEELSVVRSLLSKRASLRPTRRRWPWAT